MNIVTPSLALSNLFVLICRLISCDNQYEQPVNGVVAVAPRNLNEADLRFDETQVFDQRNDIHSQPIASRDQITVPETVTKAGNVSGYYMTVLRGRLISAFEGIPYAESPVGHRRFQDPEPKSSWTGTFVANNPGSVCLQLHYGRLRGEEDDCLRLNVYTPTVNPTKPYPVIIFIHGGFWLSGSGSYYGASYLLSQQNLVIVTFNYRLGILGFFSTGDEASLGNWGMKDQSLVIQWVHDNIRNFGGDPDSITLAGSSAGGVSAHFHMMSNFPTKGLIQNAISMSGTAYNVWGLNSLETSKKLSLELANLSGCPTSSNTSSIIDCMRKVSGSVLVANQMLTFGSGFFLPSIEPSAPGAFLATTPDEAYSSGNVARIPWIVSMTSRELNLPIPALQTNVVVSFLRTAFNADLPSLLSFKRQGLDERLIRRKILKFYSKGNSVNELSREEFSQIATHRYFSVPIRKAIQMHSQIAPTYAAIFNYSSDLGRAGRRGLNHLEFGSFHGDDLVYILNSTVYHPPIQRTDAHFAITKLMVNLYGNFAEFSEPLFVSDKKKYRIWDAVQNQDRLRFLSIDEEVKMIEDPYRSVAKFWESLALPNATSYFRLRR